MLRINLLPSYVTQRRLTKRLVPFAVLAVVLSVVLPLLWYASMKTHLTDLTQQADSAEQAKNANDALVSTAASTKAKVKPIQDKVDFVMLAHKYDRDQVGTISTVANKSPRNSFIYSSMAPGAGYQTMSIKAYSKSVEEVGRYLTAMYHQKAFTSVAVDKIPGYPDTVQHRWYLGKTMVFADGGGSAASGGGGYPGGGGAATGGAASVEPNSPNNIPPGVGPPPGVLTTDLPGGGGQGGGYSVNFLRVALAGVSPFASADVQARILRNKLRQVRRVTIPKGFDLNVTATVAPPYAPLSAPAPPGSAPVGGAGAGAFASAAPGPGAYPGGSGSGSPGPGAYPGAGAYPGGRPGG